MLGERLPNIQIEFEPLSDGFEDKTLAMMVAGTAPDVITGWGPVFRKWAEKGQLLDLQPFVDRDLSAEDLADFHQWQWDGMVTKDTKIRFAVPYYINLIVLYYNKAAFDEAGVAYPDNDWTTTPTPRAAGPDQEGRRPDQALGRLAIPHHGYDRIQIIVQAVRRPRRQPGRLDRVLAGQDGSPGRHGVDPRPHVGRQLPGPADADPGRRPGHRHRDRPLGGRHAGHPRGRHGRHHGLRQREQVRLGPRRTCPKGPARRATLGTTDGWAVYKGTKHARGVLAVPPVAR